MLIIVGVVLDTMRQIETFLFKGITMVFAERANKRKIGGANQGSSHSNFKDFIIMEVPHLHFDNPFVAWLGFRGCIEGLIIKIKLLTTTEENIMARLLGLIPNRKKIEYSLRSFTALASRKGARRNGY